MKPSEVHNQKILFSALNWGFGHVSRSIGLIDQLLGQKNELIIACNKDQQHIYEQYFPQIDFVCHEGYPFKFSGKGRFELDMFLASRSLRKRLIEERTQVSSLINEYAPDLVISDHRYGFRSESVPSIFVTHQLNLPVKWYSGWIQRWHKRLIQSFDSIWVLDYDDSRLAGDLSKNINELNCAYIGPYSRFMISRNPSNASNSEYKKLLLVSGPDIYGQQLLDEFNSSDLAIIGSENLVVPMTSNRIEGNWHDYDNAILNADTIITRSGYSSILDQEFVDAEFFFVPTSGQAEQEYLFQLQSKQHRQY